MKKAALFGALAALALPPVTFFPILLICVPVLLGMIAQAPTRRRAFWIGYVFGFAHQLVGIYWITEAILIEVAHYWWLVPFAVPALAAILGLLTAIPCVIAWHARTPLQRAVALAGAWVLADLARQFIATGFPWNLWGSSIELPGYAGDVLIQLGAVVGIHGITLLVMLLAAAPTLPGRWRAGAAAAFVCWAGFGIWRLDQPAPPATGVTVVLVQGNVPEGQKTDLAVANGVFRRYLALTAEGVGQTSGQNGARQHGSARMTGGATPRPAGPGRQIVIWPETAAAPFLIGEDPGARQAIAAVTGAGNAALVGSVRYGGQTPYNSLFALYPGGSVAAIYDKWHLVPFGEYQPGWLPGIQLVPGSFGFGTGPRTLHVGGFPGFDPLICYEAAFTGQIVDHDDRPAWFANVTNDAWFGNSSGPRQHLAAARMRAVEEGVPLMRAANTGISAGFDADGRELGRIGLNRAGALSLALPGALQPTPYSHLGLAAPGLLVALCLTGGLWPMRRRDRLVQPISEDY